MSKVDYDPFHFMRVPRYLKGPVQEALKKKMVLVGGQRQVGKDR